MMQVEDSELADVAAVSAGNNPEVGQMIAEAMSKVGRKGVVTLEEGKSAENSLYVVEGMQFDRGFISPYFVTDPEKMAVEYDNCRVCFLFYLSAKAFVSTFRSSFPLNVSVTSVLHYVVSSHFERSENCFRTIWKFEDMSTVCTFLLLKCYFF